MKKAKRQIVSEKGKGLHNIQATQYLPDEKLEVNLLLEFIKVFETFLLGPSIPSYIVS